jgi:hypothetical protein
MPACGIPDNGGHGAVFREPGPIVKNVSKSTGGRELPGRRYKIAAIERLRLEDRDDLVGTGIDDHDLLTNQNVVVTAPFRIDDDDLLR